MADDRHTNSDNSNGRSERKWRGASEGDGRKRSQSRSDQYSSGRGTRSFNRQDSSERRQRSEGRYDGLSDSQPREGRPTRGDYQGDRFEGGRRSYGNRSGRTSDGDRGRGGYRSGDRQESGYRSAERDGGGYRTRDRHEGGYRDNAQRQDRGDRWERRPDRQGNDDSGSRRENAYRSSGSQQDRRSYRSDRFERGGEREDRRGGYRGNSRDDERKSYSGNFSRRSDRTDNREQYRERPQRHDRNREAGSFGSNRSGDFSQKRDAGNRGDRPFDRKGGVGQDRRQPRNRNDNPDSYASTDEYVSPHGNEPTITAGVSAEELDAQALKSLRTLSGPNRDIVARHLVMAGQLIDLEPELAYEHARAAMKRAGRVDIVREAAALTAYAAGRYDDALRELRAVRRMRGDNAFRALEADCERGLGKPEKAVEIIDATDSSTLDLAEQVELILVSSGARADLGQNEVGLVLVDDALAALPEDTDVELVARLMSVKADRLRELGREEEALHVETNIPEEQEDPDIVDMELFADADVTKRSSVLKGTDVPLVDIYDGVLLDLDGVVWSGSTPVPHAVDAVAAAQEAGVESGFVTNNASRTPEQIAEKLQNIGFDAAADMVMTSAMDVVYLMKENLEEGSSVLVIGGDGLQEEMKKSGFEVFTEYSEPVAAVVQGFAESMDWTALSQVAYALNAGARYFATNSDLTIPTDQGFALGNGSLVQAVTAATNKKPQSAGKPGSQIFIRAAEQISAKNPMAVGDRLETDIAGAVAAGYPVMHVLTGVHDARDIIKAPRGQRPSYLAINMLSLLEEQPHPKHHKDNTWTCGTSQVAKVDRYGVMSLDGIVLDQDTTVTLDSYRALAAASWDSVINSEFIRCPHLTVVDNNDPAGTVVPPEPRQEEGLESGEPEAGDPATDYIVTDENALDESTANETAADESTESVSEDPAGKKAETIDEVGIVGERIPEFLPGEEELEELLTSTSDSDSSDTSLSGSLIGEGPSLESDMALIEDDEFDALFALDAEDKNSSGANSDSPNDTDSHN